MRYDEPDAVGSERAIDESERGRIRAVRAIDPPDLVIPDRELIGVSLTLAGPPAAAVIVGTLR